MGNPKEGKHREAEGLLDLWKNSNKEAAGMRKRRFPSIGDDEGVGPTERYWAWSVARVLETEERGPAVPRTPPRLWIAYPGAKSR